MTDLNIPRGSTPERHALETAQIALVFGLTGGELESEVWTETEELESGTVITVNSFWWYQGVPSYAEEDFVADRWTVSMDREYRTQVRDCMFGGPALRLSGGWTLARSYASSGELECLCKQDDAQDTASCPLCEGGGYVYIGDGWAECVYWRDIAD